MAGWLIISSEQNYAITESLAFAQQGLKKRHKKKASMIQPGDVLFYYLTGLQHLAAATRITSFVSEAENRIWVNLGKDPHEVYPWRFQMEPLIILPRQKWIPMETFSKALLHFRKWPEPHWRLGLQGQIHALRDEDTEHLVRTLHATLDSPT